MVLFKKGNWTIENSVVFRNRTVLKHACRGTREPNKTVVTANVSVVCWKCQSVIPEGMIALWKFQNWEELADG